VKCQLQDVLNNGKSIFSFHVNLFKVTKTLDEKSMETTHVRVVAFLLVVA